MRDNSEDFKPHKWCGEKQLYEEWGSYRQFPEGICLPCRMAQRDAKTYRRGYRAGWMAATRAKAKKGRKK